MGRKISGALKRNKKKSAKPSSPAPRTGHVMASNSAGGVILAGGYSDKSIGFVDVWRYVPSAGWMCLHESVRGSSSPLPRSMAAACVSGDSLYFFGGMQQEGSQMLVYNDLWEFNINSQQWRCLVEEVEGVSERCGAAMVSLPDGTLLLHGGECLGASFGDCFVSSPLPPSSAGVSFSPVATPAVEAPTARASHSLCLVGDVLVLFGGTTTLENGDTVYHNDVWTLSHGAGKEKESGECKCDLAWQWCPRQSAPGSLAPSPRSQCATVVLSPRVNVLAVDTLEADMRALALSQGDATSHFSGDVLIYGGFGLMEDEGVDEKEDVADEKDEDEGGKMEVCTSDVIVSLTETQQALQTDKPVAVDTVLGERGESSTAAATNTAESINNDSSNRKDDDEDDEDDGSVAEGYLGDCWLLDSSSGSFCEVFVDGAVMGPIGGCAFSTLFDAQAGKQDVVAFGGFNGEGYIGHLSTFSASQITSEGEV